MTSELSRVEYNFACFWPTLPFLQLLKIRLKIITRKNLHSSFKNYSTKVNIYFESFNINVIGNMKKSSFISINDLFVYTIFHYHYTFKHVGNTGSKFFASIYTDPPY